MDEEKVNSIPSFYRMSRLLALVFCLPTALVMTLGSIIPYPNTFFHTIEAKKVNHFTVKLEEHTSYQLKTEHQFINVPLEFYNIAEIGDTLSLKRGIVDFTKLIGYNSIELIRNNHVITKESEHSVYSFYPYVLLLLFPLVSFSNYEQWKDNIYVKIPLVMVPPFTILMLLITWLKP